MRSQRLNGDELELLVLALKELPPVPLALAAAGSVNATIARASDANGSGLAMAATLPAPRGLWTLRTPASSSRSRPVFLPVAGGVS
jgi:hypothetical protein